MKMFDRHLSRHLAAYVDGELPPDRARKAEGHLSQCARCRAELEQVRLGMTIVERLPLTEAPESVWNSIQGTLSTHEPRRPFPIHIWRFAGGAAVALILVAAGLYWYSARQAETRWEVVSLNGSPKVASRPIHGVGHIAVGEWIETSGSSRARIKVGEIGSVDVEPNTRLRLVTARPGEHRLALRSGEITASIAAPPRLFFVETPAGTAVDLGCQYKLHCDATGHGLLRVTAGWVSIEWSGREALVPAGASCRTRPRIGPGTPYFDDAPARLVGALETFDFADGSSALGIILAASRARDTLTLWHLLSRVGAAERPRVYDRMVEFSAPPSGVSRDQVLRLDAQTLGRWREELAWTW